MLRSLAVAGLVSGLAAGAVLADSHDMMEPPPGPELVLAPPEGFEPPPDMPPPPMTGDPEADRMAMQDMFFTLLAGGDDAAEPWEVMPWVKHFHMPPPPDGEMMEGDMPPPPEGDMMMDDGMEPPPHPEAVLAPPEGFMPPEGAAPPPPSGDPEADREAMIAFFLSMVDADGSGAVERHEFHPWVRHFHMPPPPEDGMMPPPDGEMHDGAMMDDGMMHDDGMMDDGMMHEEGDIVLDAADPELADLEVAPDCSDVVREAELSPVETDVSCHDGMGPTGNLVYRTVCNSAGGNTAISLPGGRMAGCFGLHAVRGMIGFRIVREDGGDVVWHMGMGKEAFRSLVLEGADPNEVYRIEATGGSWDGAATVQFIDAPSGM